MMDATMTKLIARIEELERRLADAETSVEDRTEPREGGTAATSSRRMLLLGGAVAGAGVASALVPRRTAHAIDPSLMLGETRTTEGFTQAVYTDSTAGSAFIFQAAATPSDPTVASYPSAIGGWTWEANLPNGVYGYSGVSSNAEAAGVVGSGPVGVRGVTTTDAGTGVLGIATEGVGVKARAGYGMAVEAIATNGTAVRADGGGVGVVASGTAAGVTAESDIGTGIVAYGGETGVEAHSDDVALWARFAGRAALYLGAEIRGGGTRQAPPLRTDLHVPGEIDIDQNNDLWLCVASGWPGTWRKLSGPNVAGSFHALTPGRVYDSRVPDPGPVAALVTGQEREISVSGRRQLDTGTVELADFVPPGASAIAANVTVVDTVSTGLLTVNPGGVHSVGAATINWSTTGQVLNNGVILALDGSRRLNVIASGAPGASAHFVIDVTGYYR